MSDEEGQVPVEELNRPTGRGTAEQWPGGSSGARVAKERGLDAQEAP